MKATELRIGNYVDYPLLGITTIDSGEQIDGVYEAAANPILITEEWLLKFGFKHHQKAYPHENYKTIDGFCLYKENECFVFRETINTAMGRIQYVHQLQNLYFALTGEEL
jgi:hypothetical protein